MAIKITKKDAEANTSTEVVDNKTKKTIMENHTSEKVAVPKDKVAGAKVSLAAEPQCEVHLETGYTHNLGNFTSARVSVGLTVPCGLDELDPVFAFVEEWVNTRMNKLVEEIKAE